ncbi:unnamed protein product [Heligmosomoides polygyrus]|uniref:Signal peptide peptidase-like 2B n=1 Tax=Heligmosomoides polygyrus TaxID=6339 RepID=A0A183GUK8_HELPZ|nr:unnamed protein product [Heligmosomoides polygyrus]
MDEGDIEDAKKDDYEYMMKVEVDTHDIVAISVCLLVAASHLYQRHWITNNVIGIAFSIYGIENLHLSSFKAGSLLLAGLFIYDVFWVFATDVMTSVAKGIDAPILLQFPQDLLRHGWKDASKHSMLGLGDIVIPGIFIALLRRFDLRIGDKDSKKKQGGRYFFSITVVAYAVGLLITMLVMHHFKAAQPALLYLVPCCLFVPLFAALCTGEVKEVLSDLTKLYLFRYFFSITVVAYAVGLLITMLVMHHFKAAQPALLYLVPCCLFVPLFAALCTGEVKVRLQVSIYCLKGVQSSLDSPSH